MTKENFKKLMVKCVKSNTSKFCIYIAAIKYDVTLITLIKNN